jgi:glycyl-tRNA synthetase
MGLGRVFLAVLSEAYDRETLEDGSERTVLRLNPELAPIKIAVLPLMKKDGLAEKADEIFEELAGDFATTYDDTGKIGKRYRRQDEVGTPYCVTVDYDTLEDGTVTVRERDSMGQERIKIENLKKYFEGKNLRN